MSQINQETLMKVQNEMEVLAFYNGKGGVGKSTLTPSSAAALKKLFPDLKVGVIAADSDQRSLAWAYTPDLENKDLGLWNAIATLVDRRTASDRSRLEETIKSGVRRIRVIPELDEDHGCIDFLGCAGEIGKQFSAMPPMTDSDSWRKVGLPLLNAIKETLGWNICILDLPGSIKDPLVMAMLPCCTSVVIVSDVLKMENLSMEEEVVAQLRALDVEATGFLANKASGSSASRGAIQELEEIAHRTGVPIVAQVRELDTLILGNRAYSKEGLEILPNSHWHLPEGGLHVGFYRAAADPRKNKKTREAAMIAALEIERAAIALLATCFKDVPEMNDVIQARRAALYPTLTEESAVV
jgi:cellulose biosynthesis protein BcsQ